MKAQKPAKLARLKDKMNGVSIYPIRHECQDLFHKSLLISYNFQLYRLAIIAAVHTHRPYFDVFNMLDREFWLLLGWFMILD